MASTKKNTSNVARRLPVGTQLYDPQAFGNGENVIASLGSILSFFGFSKAGSLFLQFFDTATTPAANDIPMFASFPVAANAWFSFSPSEMYGEGCVVGCDFKSGLAWGVSSTSQKFTADASNSVWASIRYVGA